MRPFNLLVGILSLFLSLPGNAQQAQQIESGPAPAEFSVLPQQMSCQAWATRFSGEQELVGTVKINSNFDSDPLFEIRSKVKELNFKFGQRISARGDSTANKDFCAYFYDRSFGDLSIKYYCSDVGEKNWMSNYYSSVVYSPSGGSYTQICKKALYRDPAMTVTNCWLLKECKSQTGENK